MRLRAIFLLSGLLALMAADKTPPVAQAGNDQLGITAVLYPDKEAVRQVLGSDLGGFFIVIRVELTPKGGQALKVNWDDFLLRSYKDGQKSEPFAPSQIAGRGALVISKTYSGGGAVSEDRGPIWGGIPGTGTSPTRLPGMNPPVTGTAASQEGAEAAATTGAKDKENPLLATLTQKVLPQKETREPLAGLLYFSLEGKHKPKDLELQYRGAAGKLILHFR
jgi:hypothetical protein